MRGRSIASLTPSPCPTTLFTIWRIAPRRRTEPALPTTRRGRSSRSTIDGAIMLVSRMPAPALAATRSYSPSMLFRCTPVPGTITPDPEPVDAVIEAAFPRASTTEIWVVPGTPTGSAGAARLAPTPALPPPPPPAARRRRARPPLVDPPALVGVAEDQVEDRVQVGLRARELDPVAGELDRRSDELRPRPRPVRAVRRLEARGSAGDGGRRRADVEDLRRRAVEVD